MFEILKFIFKTKKFWMLPLILSILLVSLVLMFTGSSALAPMIYAIF